MWDRGWAPYVPVAQRRAQANALAKKMAAKGESLSPVRISGRNMANTFWGKAWCENLEQYRDFENRLPRGRTYARNGSVIDLKIAAGKITALVSGSSLYKISIEIDKFPAQKWKKLRTDCAHSIASLMDLLRGKFSEPVMKRLTEKDTGLFPSPKEIEMRCSCPDYAYMCKHLAAVMYGVGNRLDSQPELLFVLRDVNHQDLIDEALSNQNLDTALTSGGTDSLGSSELSEIFGIDLASSDEPPPEIKAKPKSPTRKAPARASKKVSPAKTSLKKSQSKEKGNAKSVAKKSTEVNGSGKKVVSKVHKEAKQVAAAKVSPKPTKASAVNSKKEKLPATSTRRSARRAAAV